MGSMGGMVQSIMFTTGAIILGSIVLSIVIIILVRGYARRMSGADLRSTGIPAQATIVRMWDTGTTINDHPVAGMLLEVQPPTGAPYQIETKSMIPRLAVGQVQPGAVVRVKIDPRNSQHVALDLFGS